MLSKSGKIATNTFDGGMNLDIDKALLKPNQYRYAENIRFVSNDSATSGSISNIEGSVVIDGLTFEDGEEIIATSTVRNLGIVFTVLPNGNNKIYRLVFNGDELDLDPVYGTKNILNANGLSLGLTSNSNISIVSRYEDDDNIKVYWADGVHFLRSINIAHTNDQANLTVSNANIFDITPSENLSRPEISNIGTGRLNAGSIQYFYQLYGPSGTETLLSPGSAIVNLTASDISEKSIDYLGTGLGDIYGKPTGKSVKVGIYIQNPDIFSRIKLISVYYYNYSESPVINIVKDMPMLVDTNSYVYLEDGGASAIGELTLEEFNLIGGNIFIPKYIETKDNILFAGNIKEDTWDIDESIYDTRSYQFESYQFESSYVNEDGYSIILSTTIATGPNSINVITPEGEILSGLIKKWDILTLSGSNQVAFTVDSVDDINSVISFRSAVFPGYTPGDTITISEGIYSPYRRVKLGLANGQIDEYYSNKLDDISIHHDSIHSEIYEKDRYSDLEYIYNKDGYLGGSGLNVDYLFTNTYLIESYGDYWNNNPGIGSISVEKDKYIDRRTARIGDVRRNISSLRIFSSNGSSSDIALQEFDISNHYGPLNYSNPYISNSIRSYQRDEIYRFAAVFYNNKGQKSPAHWIADVRFPAGYYKDENWNSSIFEIPEESSQNGYSDLDLLKNQELLVNPLGISFTFKNLDLIPDVTKIEIVRAKRDINNKTIHAQGVVQKVGKYYEEPVAFTENNFNRGISGTLRPHQIISMGYNYGVCPILYTNSTISRFTNDDLASYLNYGDVPSIAHAHVESPYHSNINTFLFVNPETSYYGVDFSEQLISSAINIKANIIDLIYPIQTPALDSSFDAYFGQQSHDRLTFNYNSDTFPSAIYLGADINKFNIVDNLTVGASNTFFLNGLAGGYYKNISGESSTATVDTTSAYTDGAKSDIIASTSSTTLPYNRAYISLGGISSNTWGDANNWYHQSGFDGQIAQQTQDAPIVSNYGHSDNNYPGITFKYFNRYSYNSIHGGYIGLLYQNSRDIDDTTYSIVNDLNGITFNVNSIEYSGNINSISYIGDITASEYIGIGDSQYLNYTYPLTVGNEYPDELQMRNTIAKGKSIGIHGDGLLINFETGNSLPSVADMSNWRKSMDDSAHNIAYNNIYNITAAGMSTFVVNLKSSNSSIYGGSSLIDRQFTEYISTGGYINNTGSDVTKHVFGGDTFIGIFDYAITKATDPVSTRVNDIISDSVSSNDKDELANIMSHQVKYVGAMIPLESSINMRMSTSKSYVADDYNFSIQSEPGVYSPGASTGTSWSRTQNNKQFSYNSVYSTENKSIGHSSKLLITENDNIFDCRIYSSEAKTNDEIYDSWATFKVANYIDVDTKHGEITGLKNYRNRLMFWQENAFGAVAVNERALIKDNNISALTLGTGGILARTDYVTTTNGKSKNSINNIAESDSGMYWYDHKRAEFCIYNDGVGSISKARGVQSILNKSKDSIENNVPMIYDKKYNEIILTLNGILPVENIDK